MIGTLPNGLRYYLQTNQTPAHRAELRLVVNAGSLQEDDDQRGFAHFLEHMAFNGTHRFPGNRIMDVVESWGMNFGADLNAYTSFAETVYRLTVPTDDPEMLRQGLHMLEDWSRGGMLLDSAAVLAERGVVLAEGRVRRNPAGYAAFLHMHRVLRGSQTRYPDRLPIGIPEQIEAAMPDPVRRYYRDWYRPDLIAVVVTGDFDRAIVEAEIRRTFGAIRVPGASRPRIADPVVTPDTPVFDLYRPAGNMSQLVVAWRQPPVSGDTREAIRRELHERLILEHLAVLIHELATKHMRAFAGGQVAREQFGRDFDAILLRLTARPDSIVAGLRAALTEVEHVAQYGIPEQDLAQRKAAILRELEYGLDDGGRVSSSSLADRLVRHYLQPGVALLSTEQYVRLVRELLPAITPSSIAQAARFWRDTANRYVLLTVGASNDQRLPTREEFGAVMADVQQQNFPAAVATSSTRSLHPTSDVTKPGSTRNGPRGTILAERTFTGSGITEWTLSNGARVVHRRTTDHPGEVSLQAYRIGGTSRLPDSLISGSGRFMAELLTAAGNREAGFDDDAEQNLREGHDFRVALNYLDGSITLTGAPRELEGLFRILHRTIVSPELDSSSLATWHQQGMSPNVPSSNDMLVRRFTRAHPRSSTPSRMQAQNIDFKDARAVFADMFGDASALTFIVVGAVTAKEVRPWLESYLATLPTSAAHSTPVGTNLPYALTPTPGHPLQGNRASGSGTTSVEFGGPLPTTPNQYFLERQRFELIAWVTQRRLRNLLREQLSGTYSLSRTVGVFELPQPYWRLMIGWESEKSRLFELIGAADKELNELRTHGMSQEELTLARTIQQRSLETRLQSNRYWITAIQESLRLGLPLDRVTSPYTDQTLGEINGAVKRYLAPPVR